MVDYLHIKDLGREIIFMILYCIICVISFRKMAHFAIIIITTTSS